VKVQRDVAVPELDPPATPKKDCLILLALSANSASRDRSKGSGPDSIVSIHLPGSRISFPLMPSMVDWYAGDPTLKYSQVAAGRDEDRARGEELNFLGGAPVQRSRLRRSRTPQEARRLM
jgi:hypothetical protein